MITKIATFRGVSDSGEPLVRMFHPEEGLEKLGAEIHPEVRAWLSKHNPSPDEIVVLVNALGASEYYGQNVNGDYFTWEALSHECGFECASNHPIDSFTRKQIPMYGYKTFYNAHPFSHHKNKDPARAFGRVALSVLNHHMKRVELVLILNKEKARLEGAGRVIERLENGEYPDVSMGCRVAYDVCRICAHKSRTRADYCKHVKDLGMGTILPDGRQVGVDNPYPRFFDISFVFIGADRTAKVMAKLASGIGDRRSVPIESSYVKEADSDLFRRMLTGAVAGAAVGALGGAGYHKVKGPVSADVPWGSWSQALDNSSPDSIFESGKALNDPLPRQRFVSRFSEVSRKGRHVKIPGIDRLQVHRGQFMAQVAPKGRVDIVGRQAPVVVSGPLPRGWDKESLRDVILDGVSGHLSKIGADNSIGPPPSPNRKEYPYVGTIDFQGLKIYVENSAGDIREGEGPDGKKWRTKIHYPYGEIIGTKGTDKDRLDVYVGPNRGSHTVYVIHQNHPGNHPTKAGKYDEDKVMLGFDSGAGALAAYLKHYDRSDFFRSMTVMDLDSFKKMIHGEVKGEKVASLQKCAVDARLEDLFNYPSQKRVRIWKDMDGSRQVQEGPFISKTAGLVDSGIRAAVSDKTAAARKMAEIVKKIDPDGLAGKIVSVLKKGDPELPSEILDQLGKEPDLKSALSTTSGMGIVLKPREFQRIILVRAGRNDLADEYDSKGIVFGPSPAKSRLSDCLEPSSFSQRIMRMLLPMVENHSCAAPVAGRRIIRITITGPLEKRAEVEVNSPLLLKISSAYNWYRDEMLKVAVEIGPLMVQHPELASAVYGVGDEDIFSLEKVSNAPTLDAKGVAASLAAFPITLALSRSYRRDKDAGEDLGVLRGIIAKYPLASSLGTTALAREIFKTEAGKQLLEKLLGTVKATGKALVK